MVKFFDSHIRPPKGGWQFPIQGRLITAYSEQEVVEAVQKSRVNNGGVLDEDAIRTEIWQYYCDREPERCGRSGKQVPIRGPVLDSQLVQAPITPELQGPPIWMFLNTLAAQWSPSIHDYFLATCDAIIVILECPNCRNEWRAILRDHPPAVIRTKLQACQWVWMVHNLVNARTGKQQYPYRSMVLEFGAPIP